MKARVPIAEGDSTWMGLNEAPMMPEFRQASVALPAHAPVTGAAIPDATIIAQKTETPIQISSVASSSAATRLASEAGALKPEVTMVTNVLTWLATDSEGNYISRTSTYINDKAEIDWEPTSLTFRDPEPAVPTSMAVSPDNLEEIPQGWDEIPPWTVTKMMTQETVARSKAGAAPTAASDLEKLQSEKPVGSYGFGSLPVIGIPFSWLASSRGSGQSFEDLGGSQRGRIEEDEKHNHGSSSGSNSSAIYKEILNILPSAIASLLRSDPDFNLGLQGDRTPSALELELLLNLGNGQPPVAATFIPDKIPSLILPSATVHMGGPAVTVQGQVLSLAPQGLIAGTKTISLKAMAPVNPTDYAAILTLEDAKSPITFVKEAGNPQFMYNNDATLTVGGPALTTAGHTIEYNTRGVIVVDGIQTIDPSPVRKAEVAEATNRAAGGGPSGSGGTKSNGRMIGGILIDGSMSDSSQDGASSSPNQSGGYNLLGLDGAQAAAQKAGADSGSASTTTKKITATAQAASSSPTASAHVAAGVRVSEFSGGLVLLYTLLTFLGAFFML
jgi:hypothetical protein